MTAQPQAPPRGSTAGWWLALGLAMLSALVLLILQQQIGAMLAGLVAAGAAIGIGLQWRRAPQQDRPLLGDGPYDTVACRVDAAFTASIVDTMEMMLDRLALPANEHAELQAELAQIRRAGVADEASICRRCADLAKRLMCLVREEMQSASSDSSVELS